MLLFLDNTKLKKLLLFIEPKKLRNEDFFYRDFQVCRKRPLFINFLKLEKNRLLFTESKKLEESKFCL